MAASRFVLSGRAVRVAVVLVASSIALSVRAAEQPRPQAEEAALAADAQARFVVVPLRRGVALASRNADGRVEIAGGVVMAEGVPLSGEEVRRRFGADADVVLRLSYLDDAALQQLFRTPAPRATAPAAVPPEPRPAPAPPVPPAPPVFDRPTPEEAAPVVRRSGARLGVAKAIVVKEDEDIRNGVFSLGGPVRIEGRVHDGVVVIGSDLELTPTADVRGDLTVVGGQLTIADGARHAGAVHHTIGASWRGWAWPSFGWSRFEPSGAARWLPLAGTSVRLVLLALAIAVVALFARGRLARIGAAASARPVRSALVGLAAQILFVPALIVVAIVLAVTIVGLPFIAVVVPLAVFTFLGAMLLGFASLALRLGQAVTGGAGDGSAHPALGALAGMALLVLPTLVARLAGFGPDGLQWPAVTLLVVGAIVEYLAWTVGLGAAVTTGLGRWAVVPPPVPPPPPFSTEPPVADAPSAI